VGHISPANRITKRREKKGEAGGKPSREADQPPSHLGAQFGQCDEPSIRIIGIRAAGRHHTHLDCEHREKSDEKPIHGYAAFLALAFTALGFVPGLAGLGFDAFMIRLPSKGLSPCYVSIPPIRDGCPRPSRTI
jgi:hypothetical protein